jgi:hypothetical protein
MSRSLADLRLAALMLDGIDLKARCCVVALGVTTDSVKVPLGLSDGSTENKTITVALLTDLVERGLDVVGEPREVLADFRGVRASRLLRPQRRGDSSRTGANGSDRPTAARPRRRAGAELVFSEADPGRCGGPGSCSLKRSRQVTSENVTSLKWRAVVGCGVRRTG